MVQDLARSRATDLIPADVLAHVPGSAAAGVTARAARLYGGTVNSTFRVDTSVGRFVVRIHHPAAEGLGANHDREARLHATAAAAGLAPALVHVDPGHAFMVMEYVAGPVWMAQDFTRTERLTQLGATLRALHRLNPPEVAPYDLAGLIHQHYERQVEAAPGKRAWLDSLMERAQAALKGCGSEQRPQVLIHNDLYHSNLIGTERVYLLDWEYAAVADPLFDLACLLAYYPQAAPNDRALLEASGLADEASLEMLRHATWLYVLVSYLWYRSRRLAGPPDTPASRTAEQSLLKRLRTAL